MTHILFPQKIIHKNVVHNYDKQMKIGFGFDKYPEEYDYIATFENVAGIEGEFIVQEHIEEDDSTDLCELTLFNCNINKEEFKNKFEKESELYNNAAYLYILSPKGEILTSNFISGVQITKIFTDNFNNLNIKIDGWLHASSRGFYEIAQKRIKYGIDTLGQWKNLPSNKVQGWLDAAIRLGIKPTDVSNKIATIDSDGLDTEDKFYCAIGEAVNGPGGYFGRGLHALSDCFGGDFGVKDGSVFTLNWINHKTYKKKFPDYFQEILKIFSENRKNINLK